MAELSFGDQLWLTVIDKVVLASVLVAVGYVANRRLERYKSSAAFRSKIDELRVPRMRREMRRFENTAREVNDLLSAVFIQSADLTSKPRNGYMDVFASTTLDDFTSALKSRNNEVGELHHAIAGAFVRVTEQRYWLGNELTSVLTQEYHGLALLLTTPKDAFRRAKGERAIEPIFRRFRKMFLKTDAESLRELLGIDPLSPRTDDGRLVEHLLAKQPK